MGSVKHWLAVGLWLTVLTVGGWLAMTVIQRIKASVWDGQSQLIIGWGQETLAVWRWREKGGNLRLLKLPVDLLLPLAQGYGNYRVGAVAALDRWEGKQGWLVKLSLQEGLGMGVDGYAVGQFDKLTEASPRQWLIQLAWGGLTGKVKTNLTWWDWMRLWWSWGKIRGGVDKVDVGELVALAETELPDGAQVKEISVGAADQLSQKWAADEQLRGSGVRLTVVNATSHKGLGGQVGRILGNMGAIVVNVTDTADLIDAARVEVGNKPTKEASYVAGRVSKMLGISKLVKGDTNEQRAEVVVWVGEDYWQRVFGKGGD